MFQRELLAELAKGQTDERYLAGGAALHFEPHSTRFSDDLDFFHDSIERVASTFAADRARLEAAGYSSWRFMPLVRDPLGGLLLHPIDLAINKVLALAGRDEPRDFVDILFVHATVLSLGAVCWAAVGKDPGFTPLSLLELLKRRGRYRPEEFARLALAAPFDLVAAKQTWLAALAEPDAAVAVHFGAPGGVLPQLRG
jgi:hypothetical protein